MHTPKISIPMVTFRHANWVGEAIESVLAQDYPDWEIVVADDQSDDDTLAVARSYEDACQGDHGPRLRILPVERKYGRRANYERVLAACRGRYTAQLDGDDVFIDTTKLRRQAQLLDDDTSLVGVFGAWHETDEHLQPVGDIWRGFGLHGRTRFGCADFGGHCVTTTCVAMFRTRPYGEMPEWWRAVDVGDWPLHMINTEYGDYLYVDEVLSAHRNHGAGVWSARSEHDQVLSSIRTHELFLANLSDEGPDDRRAVVRAAALRSNWGRARGFLRQGRFETALPLLEFCERHRTTTPSKLKLWHRLRKARRGLASKAAAPA